MRQITYYNDGSLDPAIEAQFYCAVPVEDEADSLLHIASWLAAREQLPDAWWSNPDHKRTKLIQAAAKERSRFAQCLANAPSLRLSGREIAAAHFCIEQAKDHLLHLSTEEFTQVIEGITDYHE